MQILNPQPSTLNPKMTCIPIKTVAHPSSPPWVATPSQNEATICLPYPSHLEQEAIARDAERIVPRQAAPRPEQIAARGIMKSYQKGPIGIPVLQGVDLAVSQGEFLSIIGQSGSGKSTLLHLLGTLDKPDVGEIWFEGNRIDNLPACARDLLRNKHLGMIFQFYHLLPELTTLENVLSPAYIAEGTIGYWRHRKKYHQRAKELLHLVGLETRMKHKPRELSGGEMQRAAIARSLLANPRVLLADEPTGNLDRATGDLIMEMLHRLNRQQKLTIVMVTHDSRIAEQADRTVRLTEGRIEPAAG
jgi:lipoprotein-releasing system ATP-binding protein